VSPLGVSIDDQNVVVAVDEGSPAEGVLLPGDKLLAVDGVALRKRRCVQVMRPQPTHTFQVRRDTGSRLERMALPAEIKAEIKAEVMSESSQPAKPRPPKPLLSERSGKGAKGSKKAVGSKKAFFGTRKNVFAYDEDQMGEWFDKPEQAAEDAAHYGTNADRMLTAALGHFGDLPRKKSMIL